MAVDNIIESLGIDECCKQLPLVTVKKCDRSSVQFEPGKVAAEFKVVVLVEPFQKKAPIAIVVPEDSHERTLKAGEPGDDERCDVITSMEYVFDPCLVEPFDGSLDRPPAIVGVGDYPDPHDGDGLAPFSDMSLYQSEPLAFAVVAG